MALLLTLSTGPTWCPLNALFGVGQVSRETVALVKPVTSAPRPSMGPTPGEDQEGGRSKLAGVLVYKQVCEHRGVCGWPVDLCPQDHVYILCGHYVIVMPTFKSH
jgi:hypothetical protein